MKGNTFCKPYDKAGLKIKLEEKKAAAFVTKGELEAMPEKKAPEKKSPPVKKAANKKEPPKKAKK